MAVLEEAGVPFLVGGAYAIFRYTGIERHTKDFDVFVRRTDVDAALSALQQAGYSTEITFPHWLGKARLSDEIFVDVIYSSGNQIAEVDDGWFENATPDVVLDTPVLLVPPEEMIWSKAFIMERERFDGADVAHLIWHQSHRLDWSRLLWRFAAHWRVLYVHLVLFGYVYPGRMAAIPPAVMELLSRRLMDDYEQPVLDGNLCRGTLLSRAQYLQDVRHGLDDARLEPEVGMSESDVALWTAGIARDGPDSACH